MAWHPGYAAVVALLGLLGAPLLPAAQAVAVLGSALVAPAAAGAAWLLAGRGRAPAAFAAGLVAAAQPYPVRLGAQVMAYGLAHAVLAGAVLLCFLGLRRRSAPWLAGAGALVGAGFVVRSDALATGAGLGLGVALALLLPRRRAGREGAPRLGRRLGLALAWGAGLALALTPYLVVLRVHAGEWRLSPKKTVAQLTTLPGPRPAGDGAAAGPELQRLIRLEDLGGDPAPLAREAPFPIGESAAYAFHRAFRAAHPLVAVLALLGLGRLVRRGRARGDPDPETRRLLPLLPLAFATFGAAHTMLKVNWGYTSHIHTSAAAVLVAPLAGWGLALAAGPLARRLGRRRRPVLAALLGATLLVLLPKALEPRLAHMAPERAVGRLVREAAGPGPLVVCGREARVVAWHAGADGYLPVPPGTPARALERARAAGADVLVVHVRTHGERPRDLDRTLDALGLERVAHDLRSTREDLVYEWLVYRLE